MGGGVRKTGAVGMKEGECQGGVGGTWWDAAREGGGMPGWCWWYVVGCRPRRRGNARVVLVVRGGMRPEKEGECQGGVGGTWWDAAREGGGMPGWCWWYVVGCRPRRRGNARVVLVVRGGMRPEKEGECQGGVGGTWDAAREGGGMPGWCWWYVVGCRPRRRGNARVVLVVRGGMPPKKEGECQGGVGGTWWDAAREGGGMPGWCWWYVVGCRPRRRGNARVVLVVRGGMPPKKEGECQGGVGGTWWDAAREGGGMPGWCWWYVVGCRPRRRGNARVVLVVRGGMPPEKEGECQGGVGGTWWDAAREGGGMPGWCWWYVVGCRPRRRGNARVVLVVRGMRPEKEGECQGGVGGTWWDAAREGGGMPGWCWWYVGCGPRRRGNTRVVLVVRGGMRPEKEGECQGGVGGTWWDAAREGGGMPGWCWWYVVGCGPRRRGNARVVLVVRGGMPPEKEGECQGGVGGMWDAAREGGGMPGWCWWYVVGCRPRRRGNARVVLVVRGGMPPEKEGECQGGVGGTWWDAAREGGGMPGWCWWYVVGCRPRRRGNARVVLVVCGMRPEKEGECQGGVGGTWWDAAREGGGMPGWCWWYVVGCRPRRRGNARVVLVVRGGMRPEKEGECQGGVGGTWWDAAREGGGMPGWCWWYVGCGPRRRGNARVVLVVRGMRPEKEGECQGGVGGTWWDAAREGGGMPGWCWWYVVGCGPRRRGNARVVLVVRGMPPKKEGECQGGVGGTWDAAREGGGMPGWCWWYVVGCRPRRRGNARVVLVVRGGMPPEKEGECQGGVGGTWWDAAREGGGMPGWCWWYVVGCRPRRRGNARVVLVVRGMRPEKEGECQGGVGGTWWDAAREGGGMPGWCWWYVGCGPRRRGNARVVLVVRGGMPPEKEGECQGGVGGTWWDAAREGGGMPGWCWWYVGCGPRRRGNARVVLVVRGGMPPEKEGECQGGVGGTWWDAAREGGGMPGWCWWYVVGCCPRRRGNARVVLVVRGGMPPEKEGECQGGVGGTWWDAAREGGGMPGWCWWYVVGCRPRRRGNARVVLVVRGGMPPEKEGECQGGVGGTWWDAARGFSVERAGAY